MRNKFLRTLATPAVQAEQVRSYGRSRVPADGTAAQLLGPEEQGFIAARDSFYLSSLTEDGWPYIQHRGGPPGFVRVLNPAQLIFGDYTGNRQLISAGNIRARRRVALFFMDYPARERLKIIGQAEVIMPDEAREMIAQLTVPKGAAIERAFRIDVVGFDWNCPKYITPRFTSAEVEEAVAPLKARIAELEAAVILRKQTPLNHKEKFLMKIAILGATGQVGSQLTTEALSRGHEVTGIARYPDPLPKLDRLKPAKADLADPARLAEILRGHDAVLSAVKFVNFDGAKLLAAIKNSGVPRLLVVGGAGSLEIAPGKRLVDQPDFPAEYKAEALAGGDLLKLLRGEASLDWSFLSPSAYLHAGPRTGTFRLGKDTLLVDAQGESHIAIADYAIALIDELEHPRHSRSRFTVGY